MLRLSVLCGLVFASLSCGQALALDSPAFGKRMDPATSLGSKLRFHFAAKSPLASEAGASESLTAAVPTEYASAMTWYRVAMSKGFQPPLVVRSWTYSDELPEPLQYAWIAPNGDLVARTGKGLFMLSFEDSGKNWFRELNCRLIMWPGGDAQAIMNCNDGTQRTMLIPEQGGVVIGNQQYERAFEQAPINFDDALPADYTPEDPDMYIQ